MPSWNIHLEAGERLAGKLKLSGKKRKAFLLGCLLPDINNGYINKVKVEKPHEQTHYAFDQKTSPKSIISTPSISAIFFISIRMAISIMIFIAPLSTTS